MAEPKEKKSTSMKDRLSKFLGIPVEEKSGPDLPEIIKVYEQSKETDKKTIAEILKTLNKSNPIDVRMAIVKDFCNFIRTHRVDDPRIVRSLWVAFEDFFNENRSRDVHKVGFLMMQAMIEGQYERLQLLRPEFFRVIQRSSDAFAEKYLAMFALTNRGRDISPFEDEIGSLYSEWLNIESDHIKPLLTLVTKTIKYSFVLIDEPNKDLIIRRVCEISNSALDVEVVERCLNLLEVLVIHGTIPATCLMPIISSLCRSVNIERFSTISWQIMHAILQTHWGYQGIKCLCSLLDDSNNRSMVNLLRGAVFFLSMSVWGFQKVPNLNVSATTILPSLLKVLSGRQFIVAYEVVLGVKRLVKKYGAELKVEWNVIFNILYSLKSFMTSTPVTEQTSLVVTVREILSMIEEWYKKGQFFGDDKLLFQLFETYAAHRPEESTFFIMEKKIEEINPANERWLDNLERLITVFFVNDKRMRVREKAFNVLRQKFETFKFLYGPEIAQKAIVPNFGTMHNETDPTMRDMSIAFLVNVAENLYSSQFFQIIDLIYQLAANSSASTETRLIATTGLLNVFKTKFPFKRYNQTLYIFEKLVNLVSDEEFEIRKEVLSKLLQLRANDKYEIVLDGVTCIYLRCIQTNRTSIGLFPMANFYAALVKRLRKENRNEVFVMLVKGLHQMLTNHWIMYGIDLTETVSLVARLLENKIFGMPVDHLPISETAKFENFQLGYEMLTVMVGYLASHSPTTQIQEDIVSCFFSGIAYKWSCPPEIKQNLLRICLNSLSICVVELPDGIVKFLTQILSSIQQIANITELSMPILEWYNALVSFPNIIKKCLMVNDFKPIFTVLLQFTDYAKHSPVTVTFAYQVLALWYLQVERRQRHHFFPAIRDSLLEQIRVNKSLIAEANCDLFARYTFTDCDPLPTADEESDENSIVFKNSSTRVWVQGNSLIGIKTGQMGWVEVVLRQATGKMVWLMQLKNKIRKSGDTELVEDDLDQFLQQLRSSMALEGIHLDESDDLSDNLEGSGDIALTDSGDITDRLRQSDSPDTPITTKPNPMTLVKTALYSPSNDYRHGSVTSTTVTDTATNQSLPLSPRGLGSQSQSYNDASPRSATQSSMGSVRSPPPVGVPMYHSVTSPKLGSMTSPYMSPQLNPIKSPTGLSDPFSLNLDQQTRVKSGEMVLPLSVFYPPLPSYEEEERERRGSIGGPVDENLLGRSPSFFQSLEDLSIPKNSIKGQDATDLVQNSKLSLDAQMILHASPVKNIPPRAANDGDGSNPAKRTLPFDMDTPNFEEPTLTLTRPSLVLDTPREVAETYGSPPNVVSPPNSSVNIATNSNNNQHVNTSTPANQPSSTPQSVNPPKVSPQVPLLQAASKLGAIIEVSEDGSSSASSPTTPSTTPSSTPKLVAVGTPVSNTTTPSKDNVGSQPLSAEKTAPTFKRLAQSADKTRSGSDTTAMKKVADEANNSNQATQPQSTLSHSYSSAKHHRASISGYSNQPNPAQVHRTFSQEVRKAGTGVAQSLSGEWKVNLQHGSGEYGTGPDKDLVIHPSFVFLQLQQTPFYSSKPKLLKNSESINRALFILDHTMSSETHKFGVVYVEAGQSKQDQILKNTFGSARYTTFLKDLGEVVKIQDINTVNSAYQYTGGLDRSGQDGEYAITWRDDVTQVMFHVVTLMPNLASDQYFTNKKRHIGNDYVNIIWCEGGQQYELDTIPGQFTFVAIIISPLQAPFYRIEIKKKAEVPSFGPVLKSTIVEEKNLAFLVRQTAINANLAARVHMLQQKFLQYVSNCEERLRQIKTIEERFASDEKVDFLSG